MQRLRTLQRPGHAEGACEAGVAAGGVKTRPGSAVAGGDAICQLIQEPTAEPL